jgi:hypothetical protein
MLALIIVMAKIEMRFEHQSFNHMSQNLSFAKNLGKASRKKAAASHPFLVLRHFCSICKGQKTSIIFSLPFKRLLDVRRSVHHLLRLIGI